jgi:hypothetical protein
MTNLEKAQRYAMGECLADYYEDYTYDQACKMLASQDLNQDKDGDTIIFPIEALEDDDVVLIMNLIVDAYMEGAK